MEINPSGNYTFRLFLRVLYAASIILIIFILASGWNFYLTPYLQRPHATEYRVWRSAGHIGHGFGILGSLMMLMMLLYSLRKRFRVLSAMGPLHYWLQIHIYFGVIGPALIIFHSAFKVQGLVAVSFWSMIAVALSGVLGRYLYMQIPRNLFGEELDLSQAKEMDASFRYTLAARFGLNNKSLELIFKDALPTIPTGHNSLSILFNLWFQDLNRPFYLKKLLRTLNEQLHLRPGQVHEFSLHLRKHVVLQQRILLWNHLHSLFHYWHIIHRPFAYIMYVIMFVHIGITVWLGYTWLF